MAKYKYYEYVEPKLFLVECWARDGLTDEQIAKNLGISKDSFYRYKKEHSDFSDALKRGKEVIDFEVENALLKRAMGYTYDEVIKELVVNPETGEKELMVTKVVKKEVQPDTIAEIFWLKNRKPKTWRDRQEKVISLNANEDLDEAALDEQIKQLQCEE